MVVGHRLQDRGLVYRRINTGRLDGGRSRSERLRAREKARRGLTGKFCSRQTDEQRDRENPSIVQWSSTSEDRSLDLPTRKAATTGNLPRNRPEVTFHLCHLCPGREMCRKEPRSDVPDLAVWSRRFRYT